MDHIPKILNDHGVQRDGIVKLKSKDLLRYGIDNAGERKKVMDIGKRIVEADKELKQKKKQKRMSIANKYLAATK